MKDLIHDGTMAVFVFMFAWITGFLGSAILNVAFANFGEAHWAYVLFAMVLGLAFCVQALAFIFLCANILADEV